MLIVLGLVIKAGPVVYGIEIFPFDSKRPMADQNDNKLYDDLELELKLEKDQYPVIVHLTEPANPRLLSYLKSKIGDFTPTYIYRYFNGFATQLTKEQILRLREYSVIEKIQWDAPVEIYMDTAAPGFGVLKARQYYLVDGDRDGDPGIYTSQDVVIAFIDTGIDVKHVDLPENKVIGWLDLIQNRSTPYDDHGHGTHVAGIAAGLGIGNQDYIGVAPGAALVVVKALDAEGKSRMSIVDAGIEWLLDQKDQLKIDILSISFGSKGTADGSDSTCQLINLLVEKGINVVVAAGNQGAGLQTIGSPGAAEKAITVSGMADQGEGGEFLAYFASRGPTLDGRAKPDLCGPGWRIMAPQARTTDQYIVFSGTSMAAPFTAGIIALLLDLQPSLTPDEIKNILLKTAEDWGPEGWDPDYGMGKIQVENALDQLKDKSNMVFDNPYHFRAEEDLPSEGFYDQWIVELGSTDHILAVTMVTYLDEDKDNLNLYLYDPNGNLVAKGERGGRHEWISIYPTMAGPYTLEVVSYKGSGKYYLDFYGDILLFYLGADNQY